MEKEQLNDKSKEAKKQTGNNAQKNKEKSGGVFSKEKINESFKKAKNGVEKAIDGIKNNSVVKKMTPREKYAALGIMAFIIIVIITLLGRSVITPEPSIWSVAEAPKSELAFNSAGKVAEIVYSVRQIVPKGGVIARLEHGIYTADFENAESRLMEANLKVLRMEPRFAEMENALAEARLRAAESANEAAIAAYELAREYERRYRSYFEDRRISEAHYAASLENVANAEIAVERTENELENAKQSLEAAQIRHTPEEIEAAKQEIEIAVEQVVKARAALEGALIVAPFDAYIHSINVNVGDSVELGQPVFEVIDLSKIWLRGLVNRTVAASLRPGIAVNVEFNEIPRETFTGRIVATASESTESREGEALYEVRIELDSHGNNIRPGMEAVAIVVSN